MTPFQTVYLVLVVVAVAVGWTLGGHVERRATAMILIAMVLAMLVQEVGGGRIRWAVIVTDVALTSVLFHLSLKADRWWLLLANACCLLTLVAHVTLFLDPDLTLRVNVATRWVFGMILMLALIAGVIERRLAGEFAVTGRWRRAASRAIA